MKFIPKNTTRIHPTYLVCLSVFHTFPKKLEFAKKKKWNLPKKMEFVLDFGFLAAAGPRPKAAPSQ